MHSFRLSIITPVYNGERFIEFCIQNVIAQNCAHAEHIIVDGGSTDATVNIIKNYAQRFSHIRWLSEKDKGQADAMNKGLAMARGKIVGFLNADDFYEPNTLNRVVTLFETLPEPSLLMGNCNVLTDNDAFLYLYKPNKLKLFYLLLGEKVTPIPINPSAYFYHASLHQLIGPYDIGEEYAMDMDFILRAVRKAKVVYINETWGNFRRIAGTKTVMDEECGKAAKRRNAILYRHRKYLPLWQRCLIGVLWFFYYSQRCHGVRYYWYRIRQIVRRPTVIWEIVSRRIKNK